MNETLILEIERHRAEAERGISLAIAALDALRQLEPDAFHLSDFWIWRMTQILEHTNGRAYTVIDARSTGAKIGDR